ncbi:MAG: type II secretion system protein [Candidatus Paceibacterota bacterium]
METTNTTHSQINGFSLVEIVVAVAIFTMVATAILTSLLAVVDSSRQQQARGEAVDTLNFIVDDMMRRIRTGYNFKCGSGSGTSDGDECDTFSFTASEFDANASTNPRITYEESGGQLYRGSQQLTGPPLEITDLSFTVDGSGSGDLKQARVLLTITGEIDDISENPQSFSIQTTIAQRLLFPPSD